MCVTCRSQPSHHRRHSRKESVSASLDRVTRLISAALPHVPRRGAPREGPGAILPVASRVPSPLTRGALQTRLAGPRLGRGEGLVALKSAGETRWAGGPGSHPPRSPGRPAGGLRAEAPTCK